MKKEIPWYSEEAGFFGEVYLHNYKEILSDEWTQKDADFIEKVLNLPRGAKIFDLCCGHGRISIELAKRGYDVTGQDLNGYFLNAAGKAADEAGVGVKWVKDDMRNISFENEFDAVLNIFTSFGYLGSDEEDQKVISGVAKALKQGGKFIIDLNNRDRVIRQFLMKDHTNYADGSIEIIEREFNHVFGGNYETRKLIWPDGRTSEFKLVVRMYTVPEVAVMMKKAGLKLIHSYGDTELNPIKFLSPRYILIGEKQ